MIYQLLKDKTVRNPIEEDTTNKKFKLWLD